MRQSRAFLSTLRAAPADAEVPSHVLLARSGLLSKLGAGLYAYPPALWRTLRKISDIVREEMDRAGAQELMLPILQPRELWDASGRWDRYVADGILFHFRDRKEAELCLGPTHEEVVTRVVAERVHSYRAAAAQPVPDPDQVPRRDPPALRAHARARVPHEGRVLVRRGRAGLDVSYARMDEAYRRIFARCGLRYEAVEADAGAIGGSGSQEFMRGADRARTRCVLCPSGYAANVEKADERPVDAPAGGAARSRCAASPRRTCVPSKRFTRSSPTCPPAAWSRPCSTPPPAERPGKTSPCSCAAISRSTR